MWRSFYLCFYSKDFYRDVAQNWRGLALTHLFLILVIVCIPITLINAAAFRTFADTEAQTLIEKMPVLTFKKGLLSTSVAQPYAIFGDDKFDNGKPKEVIIFDKTGKYTTENIYRGQILITDKYFHLRKPDRSGEIRSLAFEDIPDMVVDHVALREFLETAKRWIMPVFFVSMLLLFYVYTTIKVLLYSLFAMLINRMMGAFLEYSQLVRLSVAAITPVLAVDLFLMLGKMPMLSGFFSFVVVMGFVTFGIHANRELIR